MKNRIYRTVFSLTLIAALILTGCNSVSQSNNAASIFTPKRVSAGSCSYGGEFKSIEALDEFRVRFTLCEPDAAFPAKLTSPVLAIQDKEYLDATKGNSEALSTEPNGTGPYRLLLNIPASKFELRASPNYWGLPPSNQLLFFKFLTDPALGPSISQLVGVDVTTSFTFSDLMKTMLKGNSSYTMLKHPALGLVYLGFNNKISPFDNVNVRKAFAMALDRTKLVAAGLGYGADAATQMIPKSVAPGRSPALNWYDLKPNDAADLLSSSGFDFNQTIPLTYVSGSMDLVESTDAIAMQIQSELAAIQVKVSLKPLSQKAFAAALANGSAGLFLNSFRALYPDGAAFYELPFVRESGQFGSAYTEIQAGLQDVQRQSTDTDRQTKFDALNTQFKELVPLIPIGNVPDWSLFSSSVSGGAVNGYFEDFENLSNSTNSITILEADRPLSLWPADETDYDTFRITRLLYDTLVQTDFAGQGIKPDLADSWTANSDNTQWTITLRYNVAFSNGAALDANDVVASFAAIWNTKDPNHKGRTGDFTIFKQLFGPLLNAK